MNANVVGREFVQKPVLYFLERYFNDNFVLFTEKPTVSKFSASRLAILQEL